MSIDEAIAEARRLLDLCKLTNKGWTVGINNGNRRIGLCNYTKKKIEISRNHIARGTDSEVLDTIRHEVAHALAGRIAGHGPAWKSVAIMLGANPSPIARVSYATPYKYHLMCNMCNSVLQRRMNRINEKKLSRLYCNSCGVASNGKLFLSNATTR